MISALKGRRPRPLDERGALTGCFPTGLLIVLYGPVICQAKFCEKFETEERLMAFHLVVTYGAKFGMIDSIKGCLKLRRCYGK